jgi:membrane associated rhomboid family serine protease
MDLNYLFFLFAITMTIAPIIGFFRSPAGTPRQWGWLIKCIVIALIILTTYIYAEQWAGTMGMLLVVPFIFAPLTSLQYNQRLFYKQQFRKAYHVSRFIRFLHPFDGWLEQAEIYKAIDLIDRGNAGEAAEIVAKHKKPDDPMHRWLYANYLKSTERFEELIEWFQQTLGQDKLADYPEIIINYFVALGEIGQSETLAEEFDRLKPVLDNIAFKPHLNIARLYLFAFTGNGEALEKEFAGSLALMPQESKDFWLATADMTAGHSETARETFERLKESSKHMTRLGSRRRLDLPLQKTELEPQLEEILDREIQAIADEKTFAEPISFTKHKRKAYGTYALMGAIVAGFLMEIMYGGSQDIATLYRLGAMVSPGNPGEWWRALTSMFLHFGPAHFALNLLGLYLMGPYLENITGTFRFLLIYLISGFGAMFLAPVFSNQTTILLVGASGSLMGILGATALILGSNARTDKSGPARKSLRVIIAILVFQFIIDAITPEISQAAHMLGIFMGLTTCALLWLPFKQKARDVSRRDPQ